MPLFNFVTPTSSGFNFNFGTTYTGTEITFNFTEEGYGYNDYDFNFGAGLPTFSGSYNLGAEIVILPLHITASGDLGSSIFSIVPVSLSGSIGVIPYVSLDANILSVPYQNLGATLFGSAWAKELVIKSTATLDHTINSINVESFQKYYGDDVLYVNTVSGIVRVFSPTCTGTIDDRNIVDSDYASGNCGAEIIWEGTSNKVIELNTASGTSEEFLLSSDVDCLLYYMY